MRGSRTVLRSFCWNSYFINWLRITVSLSQLCGRLFAFSSVAGPSTLIMVLLGTWASMASVGLGLQLVMLVLPLVLLKLTTSTSLPLVLTRRISMLAGSVSPSAVWYTSFGIYRRMVELFKFTSRQPAFAGVSFCASSSLALLFTSKVLPFSYQ